MLTSCKDDRISVTGYCFNYGNWGVSGSSTEQTWLTTSSPETELHALSEAPEDVLFLQSRPETLNQPASAILMSFILLVSKEILQLTYCYLN